jgi:mersacidin/lichenicidin family type 2 lantibiotic
MKKFDIARALRDEEYYLSLTDDERASLGAHPSGAVELRGDDLRAVAGAVTAHCTGTSTAVGGTVNCTPCPNLNCGA